MLSLLKNIMFQRRKGSASPHLHQCVFVSDPCEIKKSVVSINISLHTLDVPFIHHHTSQICTTSNADDRIRSQVFLCVSETMYDFIKLLRVQRSLKSETHYACPLTNRCNALGRRNTRSSEGQPGRPFGRGN